MRAAAWSLETGRILDEAVNTCVLRVTSAHQELLAQWKRMLQRPEYVAAQAQRVRASDRSPGRSGCPDRSALDQALRERSISLDSSWR